MFANIAADRIIVGMRDWSDDDTLGWVFTAPARLGERYLELLAVPRIALAMASARWHGP